MEPMQRLATVTPDSTLDTTAVAERVEANRKIRCTEAQHHPGGGGINVARAVHQLGGEATAVWTAGGLFGEWVARLLDEEGVPNVPVDVDGDTRQSFAVIEQGSRRHFRFSTPGPHLSEGELDRIVDAVRDLDPGILVLGGGLPPGTPSDFYARLAAVGAGLGARVIVDSHGEPLRQAVAAGDVFLIKPNHAELLDAAGVPRGTDDVDIEDLARELAADTDTNVLVSLGPGGAMLVTPEEVRDYGAPAVPIRSRIGAGDSMVAGTALRLAQGSDLPDAARYGLAAGAAAVMTPGTELCRADDVAALADRIRVG